MEKVLKYAGMALLFTLATAIFYLFLMPQNQAEMEVNRIPYLPNDAQAPGPAPEAQYDAMHESNETVSNETAPAAGGVARSQVATADEDAAEGEESAVETMAMNAEPEQLEKEMADADMNMVVQDHSSEVEPGAGFPLQSALLIILLSTLTTFLTWNAVENVIRKRREVMLVSFDDSKGVVQALNNDTCKKILEALGNGGKTESELAGELDMSIQRVHYNLKQLVDARLVESKKFRYSEKGREMDIYTLTNKYFIIGPGEEK